MKRTGIIVIAAVCAVIFIIIAVFAGSYNSLVTAETKVSEQQANIETQLQRRADLIPNLVATCKGYAEHETEVFDAVNAAREKLVGAGGMEEKAEANEELTSALGRLIAIAENYPELKSDALYVQLMDELAGTENRIAYAREGYNGAAAEYNLKIRRFPGVIFARMFGFEKVELFTASESAQEAPVVSFD